MERDSIKSRHIVNGQVRSIDVRDNALRGVDIDESRLGPVPLADDAAQLDGQGPSSFLGASDKAADSDLIDGMDSTAFASANAAVPAGAVSFFNLSTCPSGWSELAAARGRYLVGLVPGGTLGGTSGIALANLENRAVGQHNHGISDPGHVHIYKPGGSSYEVQFGRSAFVSGLYTLENTVRSFTGITINNAGSVAGTNAPYLQLLVCEKA